MVQLLFTVQSLSCVQLFSTPWTAAYQASLSFTISQSLLRFMSVESVMVCNYLILCCFLLVLPSIFPSIRVFPMSWLFASSDQSIGASASVLPMKFQGWFPLKVKVLVTQSYTTLCEPTNCNLPDSLSIEFSRQEYWIGLPFPSPGVISFRIHWFGISGVQGTIKSLLQHHSSKASIFWH